MKRIATYCRVSTEDQTAANQLPEVEAVALSRGEIVLREVETGSAAKVRPKFEALLQAARRREFDILVVWSIDRFGRTMGGNVRDIEMLAEFGVDVVSCREPWLDTSGPVRELLIAILSWVAKQERARLIERTKAGMARAKAEGKKVGGRKLGARNKSKKSQ
jgi:putative DNA-invertase from lambdoid prophage Rac